jgi:hypothetical protein
MVIAAELRPRFGLRRQVVPVRYASGAECQLRGIRARVGLFEHAVFRRHFSHPCDAI